MISTFRGFEARAQQRPCTREDLEQLERDFEAWLTKRREADVSLEDVRDIVEATDAVRLTLRRSLREHDKAQAELLRIRQLIQRGHVREAVIICNDLRSAVAGFSDVNLDFVAEAQARHELRHRLLLIFGA